KFMMSCAVYIYNRTLVRYLIWKTLIEMALGQKPNIIYFKVFGCNMYVFISEEMCKNKLTA
ncbi:hypothetical protein AN958_07275, partial [Leucoagaricus sp. SymC.cos]